MEPSRKKAAQYMQHLHMQHIQHYSQKLGLLRWILFLWIGFVYLWATWWGGVIGEQVNIKNVLPFTLLMLLHLSLYVVSIFLPAKHQWYRFFYFAIQILLILLIGLVSYRLIVLGLYLSLSVEMASMLHKIRLSLLVGAACTLLFSFSLTMGLLYGWGFTSFTLTHIVLPYIIPLGLLI